MQIPIKARVPTSDGDTDTFDILYRILEGYTLAPFLFIIVLDYVLRISLNSGHNKDLRAF